MRNQTFLPFDAALHCIHELPPSLRAFYIYIKSEKTELSFDTAVEISQTWRPQSQLDTDVLSMVASLCC